MAYTYTVLDTFEDGTITGWDVESNITESGGMLQLTKPGGASTYHYAQRETADIGLNQWAVFHLNTYGGTPTAGGHEARMYLVAANGSGDVALLNTPHSSFLSLIHI